jgi:hypothetical protein
MNRIFIGALLLGAIVARGEPRQVNKKLVAGVWALTTQGEAATLPDMIKALRLDIAQYTATIDEGSQKVTYKRAELHSASDENPVSMFSFTNVIFYLPVPTLPGPGLKPAQSIHILFQRDACLSHEAVTTQTGVAFRSYFPPIVSGLRAGISTMNVSARQDEPERVYFARVPGHPGENKIETVENTLTLRGECSQEVGIDKTFDYDYWPARCPFSYNRQLINAAIIPALKQRYGDGYTKFTIDDPEIKDYGSFMALRFNERGSPVGQGTQVGMTVDRCDLKVSSTWEVSAADRPRAVPR